MSGAEIVGGIGLALQAVDIIIRLVNSAKRNVDKCKLLGEHVRMIKRLLTELKKHITSEAWLKELVDNLINALSEGRALVESCQRKRTWSHVFKTQKMANKIDALGQRISMIQQSFQVGNTILILSINNGRFFENVLQKLLQDGAVKRLPQNVKENLKSSIGRLTNIDEMSPDARELLEWIKRDIAFSDTALTSRWSGAPRGNDLTVAIVELTERIKQQEWMASGDDIRRLAQLVQQVGNIIQHPQTSELVMDRKTRPTLLELQEDLQRISDQFVWYTGKKPNKIKSVMLCSPDDSIIDEVLKETYKMEYYITVLPAMALRQVYALG